MALVIKSLYNYYDYHFNEVVGKKNKKMLNVKFSRASKSRKKSSN